MPEGPGELKHKRIKSEWAKDLFTRADNSIPETFGAVFLVIDDYPYYPYRKIGPIGPLGPI